MTLVIEPSDSGVRFATGEWVWNGELYRAVRAFNIVRAVIGGGFQEVEILLPRFSDAHDTLVPQQTLLPYSTVNTSNSTR